MRRVDNKKKALEAADKVPLQGPRVNISSYLRHPGRFERIAALRELPEDIKDSALSVGIVGDESCRSGTYFQADHSVILSSVYREGLEIMSITDALSKYDWLYDYWWKAVSVDSDMFTAEAELNPDNGYFVRALPGEKIDLPLQACLLMTSEGLSQNVHNIIIAEEGAELNIITGCANARKSRGGLHIGITEFYIKKAARISFTMIHNWAEDMAVRPRSSAIIYESGVFLSTYVSINPVRTLQMYPSAVCAGNNATARFNSIVMAKEGSDIDIGARVYLKEQGSRAEVVTRAISKGGNITARGHLVGEAPDIKAHLECRGLLLSDIGSIHAIPELEGRVSNVDMSHEAAVGKIAEEEIQYLMSRGLNEEEATAAIVRGFLDVEVKGLPEPLRAEMRRAVDEDLLKNRAL